MSACEQLALGQESCKSESASSLVAKANCLAFCLQENQHLDLQQPCKLGWSWLHQARARAALQCDNNVEPTVVCIRQ